jgi:hypothetical protein
MNAALGFLAVFLTGVFAEGLVMVLLLQANETNCNAILIPVDGLTFLLKMPICQP